MAGRCKPARYCQSDAARRARNGDCGSQARYGCERRRAGTRSPSDPAINPGFQWRHHLALALRFSTHDKSAMNFALSTGREWSSQPMQHTGFRRSERDCVTRIQQSLVESCENMRNWPADAGPEAARATRPDQFRSHVSEFRKRAAFFRDCDQPGLRPKARPAALQTAVNA